MNIVYITSSKIPTEKAHGFQISKMCEEFSSAGVKVQLLLPIRHNNVKDDIFSFYGIKENFEIKKTLFFDFFRYEKFLGKLSFYLNSILFFVILIFVKIDKNTIVYSRNPEIVWLFGLRGYKTVFEAHRWPNKKIWVNKFLVKKVSKIIVITDGIKSIFLKNGFDTKKIFLSRDAVDLEKFDISITQEIARKKFNLPEEKKIICYTGKFTTMGFDKGIKNILESLQKLDNNIIFLAIGGSTSEINFYDKISKDLHVEDRVLFIRHVDQKDLTIYQKACDVLLMPFPYSEHYAYYMSPLKMFEYMASHVPIVASDLPSIREVLNENMCCFCEPDDPVSLTNAIIKALNTNISYKISNNAYEEVKKYTWHNRVKEILHFLMN